MKMYHCNECRHVLVAIAYVFMLNVEVKARSFKTTHSSGSLESHSQWETLNSVTSSLRTTQAKTDEVATHHQPGYIGEGQTIQDETAEEVDKNAKAEEQQDDEALEESDAADKNETKSDKSEKKQAAQIEAQDSALESDPEGAAFPTTTPPAEPFAHMYSESDSVARDAELRRGVAFHPQGTKPDIDMTKLDQFKVDGFFSQDPSIFGHCVLIRDFATPLRVGSAIRELKTGLRGQHRHHHHHHHRKPNAPAFMDNTAAKKPAWHANSSHAAQAMRPPSHFVRAFASTGAAHHDDGHKKDAEKKDPKKLNDDLLLLKGGVIDRDSIGSLEGDASEENLELEVNMFAFLRTVAGEVAVIPNGDISKWSSKKKVPIAGYLCTSDQGPVLHTLPTPCLPTSIDANGQPFSPPQAPRPQPPTAPPGMVPVTGQPAPAALAAADAGKKTDATKVESTDDDLDAEAEKEAKDAEAVANEALLQTKRKDGPAPAPASGPAPAPATALPPLQPSYEPYHVWVGSTMLEFKSKPKAERFCKRLTKRIAEDLGDEEWDADRLLNEDVNKQDMSVHNFMALTRKQAPEWTQGTKSVLVVVMDWMVGDSSRAPYTKQTSTPIHYRDNVFTRVREAFKKMSFGQFDISVTVVPEIVRFTKPRSRYTAGGYPFPGLYNGARDSMEGNWKFGSQYKFENYDLVYVISPQQAPTGTKGVAWVGAKGAMCNGCEAISENFQVMVAVHELGHNLGLWHASSKSLEYGNVFDWMGNYPDVTGLSYGLGYKLRLNWLPQASIAQINDASLPGLNDEYFIMPFDGAVAPRAGQLTGIRIDLGGNRRNLFVSYRQEPGTGRAGIFLTLQDRDKPNSELIDAACHSPSQQDAALQQGWTYIDPTSQVVIHAYKIEANLATVRVFKAPSSSKVSAIRARSGFTDGQWKCPRVCTDADLLVSQYKGCSQLAKDGYCKGGSITMGGTKFGIGKDLCPKSCDMCEDANSGGSLASKGCDDKNVKISGMTCSKAAAKGYCDYSTNIGHIGDDLCPKSCARCPARPAAPSSSSTGFTDPTPARTHGIRSAREEEPAVSPESRPQRDEEAATNEDSEEVAAEKEEKQDEEKAEGTCTDDSVWTDADGDNCAVYASYVDDGKLSQDEACNYGTGESKLYCRRTCNSCQAKTSTCEDKQCVTRWRYERGKCFACNEWSNHCNKDFFANDCPRTCGLCQAESPDTTPPLPTTRMPPTTTVAVTMPPTSPPTAPPPCKDESCVQSWLKSFGVCHKCADFAEDYCGRDELFMKSCAKSCQVCVDGQQQCHDDFLPHTCKRYTEWGWCSTPHIAEHCKASCGVCAANLNVQEEPKIQMDPMFPGAAARMSPLGAGLAAALLSIAVLMA